MSQKYSVLMSLYDKEDPDYLGPSLDSMLNQTVKPDEIVLVLDGPINDVLQGIVDDYVKKYPDVMKVVPLKENFGLGRALDEGLKHCENELVARMDTDDISLPSRCEKQLKRFSKDANLAIVGTMIDEFYDNPDNIVSSRVVPTEHKDIEKFIRRRSPFNHPTVMFKKSAVIDSGGYGKFKRKQDLDLFSRMINKGYMAANINESLLLFRSNEDNFKRRKSWSYVGSYIKVQYEIWKRGHCSLGDLLFGGYGLKDYIKKRPWKTWMLKSLKEPFFSELVMGGYFCQVSERPDGY